MNRIYLEYHQDAENKHRFYQMFVVPTLFDDCSLVREWGRIASPGTVKKVLSQKIKSPYYLRS
ncbi:hypothetical protein BPLS_P4956 [Bathymodiolus platifrons methanotrophic gill symbiont]|uniref:WGR domain-containing protein n=1 Tax=Bathymodiolus platifrons methanotrophic gill symbiont TaxID=113268 RepID=UPI000B40A23B|nr:WGR domain-containing protein [Bathymodiolus platifrons methanotrophic gill symbiont]TXK92863.1 WGR domain-containing protein [Methylococcaceae bacterium HT1]TXL12763.1 WGR domain-containing protein [Methylococcaceae bacterium HT5]GFO76875.1 hypothetical protein BPLS_P4956 [Bathymodiolus platifrons methanotrophic gill symbiont]